MESDSSFFIEQLTSTNSEAKNVKGYWVISNAPINVDKPSDNRQHQTSITTIESIVEVIKQAYLKDERHKIEIVIMVHGYNTLKSEAKERYENTFQYIQDNFAKAIENRDKELIFIGYRWPSENFGKNDPQDSESESLGERFIKSIKGLPVLFKTIKVLALFSAIVVAVLSLNFMTPLINLPDWLRESLLFITTSITLFSLGVIASAIVFRLTVYFRDVYRANHFGQPILVDLIRQLDYEIVKEFTKDKEPQALLNYKKRKIKLSFIAHSMGAFVVTSCVRVLSNVFNSLAIDPKADIPSNIGNIFSLGRLVLVSLDISLEALMPGQSNFLRSSLRRFEEAYLFSNQGDIILRVASTAANYLRFPANTYDRGFRLGNVTVDRNNSQANNHKIIEGIINLANFDSENLSNESNVCELNNYILMKHLFIVSDDKQKSLSSLARITNNRQLDLKSPSKLEVNLISNLFTYFDCTDYFDYLDRCDGNNKKVGVVSNALRKKRLSFWDCLLLVNDYRKGKIKVHGGYFNGEFSQEMIYGLSCLGFTNFLNYVHPQANNLDAETKNKQLDAFSEKCKQYGIQGLLSPERYLVDILGKKRDRTPYT